MIGELRRHHPVAQRVEVDEEEILGTPLVIPQLPIHARHPLHLCPDIVRMMRVLEREVLAHQAPQTRRRSLVRDSETAGVDPLQEPLEGIRLLFRQPDSLVQALRESAVERRGKEGRGGGEELLMDHVLRLRAAFVAVVTHDNLHHIREITKRRAQR